MIGKKRALSLIEKYENELLEGTNRASLCVEKIRIYDMVLDFWSAVEEGRINKIFFMARKIDRCSGYTKTKTYMEYAEERYGTTYEDVVMNARHAHLICDYLNSTEGSIAQALSEAFLMSTNPEYFAS